jgi:DNA invertase Pin-like site-specific DNA recombinase
VNGHRVSDKDSSGREEGSQRQSTSGTAVDAIESAAESYFVDRPVDRRVMRAGLYARVSTMGKGQATDNQLIQLREFSQNQHWAVIREYEDHESGGKADRTEFRVMLQDAATRKFDVLVFWSLDRLTREGTLATLKYLELIESYGVHWRSLTEPWIDSAGPFRDVIISLLASLAKQERVRISERVRAGLARAKQYGTRSGRSIGRPAALFRRDQALELRAQGLSWRKIAQIVGVSATTVRRACTGPMDGRQP